jgi:hypothetical protein
MTVGSSDLEFVLSGGSANTNPDASLGGEPSVQPLVMSVLFDDLTEAQTASGNTDFRALYLVNDNAADALYAVQVYVASQVSGGADATLGFLFRDDRQQITITNYTNMTGGSFVLRYETTDITIAWDGDDAIFAGRFQTALRAVGEVTDDCTVSATISANDIIFEIDFMTGSGDRYHTLMTEVSNGLIPATSTIAASKLVNGSPINAVAGEIDVDTTTPAGVVFSSPTVTSPIEIGRLGPLDILPIWIKRIADAGIGAVENDGLSINVKGEPIKPLEELI